MDVPVSAIAGSAKLALSVVSNRQRPVLEVYATIRNRERPEEVFKTQLRSGQEQEHRVHGYDVFVDFVLANIGGLRAENIRLGLSGDFALLGGRKKLSSLAFFQGAKIPQMAPAQQFPLFHIDVSDFDVHGPDGKVTGWSKDRFTMKIEYNGPRSFLGRLKRRKYTTKFEFSADIYEGALIPPPEYR